MKKSVQNMSVVKNAIYSSWGSQFTLCEQFMELPAYSERVKRAMNNTGPSSVNMNIHKHIK